MSDIPKKAPFNRWAATWQNQQNGCAPSEDSYQPGHSPSLIRVFAVRTQKPWVLSYPLSAHRRLWSDLGGCPGWSVPSLGAHSFLLVLSCHGSDERTHMNSFPVYVHTMHPTLNHNAQLLYQCFHTNYFSGSLFIIIPSKLSRITPAYLWRVVPQPIFFGWRNKLKANINFIVRF